MEQKSCINWAVEKYGRLDGDTLSHITHNESPWREARGNLKNEEYSNKEITINSILSYYSKLPKYSELEKLDESEN